MHAFFYVHAFNALIDLCALCVLQAGTLGLSARLTDFSCSERCKEGHYCPKGSNEPIACPAGTFSAQRGMGDESACAQCTIGYYCPEGAASPTKCEDIGDSTGTSLPGAKSSAECVCTAGSVGTNATGEYTCLACYEGAVCDEPGTIVTSMQVLPGYWRVNDQTEKVHACPTASSCIGWTAACDTSAGPSVDASTAGRRQMAVLPSPSSAAAEASATKRQCTEAASAAAQAAAALARVETFDPTLLARTLVDKAKKAGDVCISTPSHASADQRTQRHGRLLTAPAATNATNCSQSVSRAGYKRFGKSSDSTYCAYGHQGPFCSVCEPDWYMALDGRCNSCEGHSLWSSSGLFHIIIVAALACVMISCLGCAKRWSKLGCAKRWSKLWSMQEKVESLKSSLSSIAAALQKMLTDFKVLLPNKFRILVSLVQVLKRLGVVYSIPYPEAYLEVLRWLSFIDFEFVFNFELMPMNCIMESNYHVAVLFYTFLPLGVYTVLMLFFGLARLHQKGFSWCLWIDFLIYPAVTAKMFGTFVCTPLDDGRWVLEADMSIDCDSEKHKLGELCAYAGLLVHTFGTPFIYKVLFVKHRPTILAHQVQESRIVADATFKVWSNAHDSKQERVSQDCCMCYQEDTHRAVAVEIPKQLREVIDKEQTDLHSLSIEEGEKKTFEEIFDIIRDLFMRLLLSVKRETKEQKTDQKQEEQKTDQKLPRYMNIVIGPYKASHYDFEVFECFRKVATVGLPVFFYPGQFEQLVLGLLVSGISMMTVTAMSPYRLHGDNVVAVIAQVAIFCTLLSGVILHADLGASEEEGRSLVITVVLSILSIAPFAWLHAFHHSAGN